MFTIQKITSDARQTQNLILSDGTVMKLTLYFRPMQYGWFIEELTRGTFTLRGMRVVNSPNMLHQFYQQIPFGLACFSQGNREPSLQQDFSSGQSALYILSEAEVLQYVSYLKNG